MDWHDLWTALLGLAACFFITVGSVGVLRLADLHARLHAMAKADTLGLGLLVLALLPRTESVAAGAKLLLVWALALVSAAVIAHLLARGAPVTGLAEPPIDATGRTDAVPEGAPDP